MHFERCLPTNAAFKGPVLVWTTAKCSALTFGWNAGVRLSLTLPAMQGMEYSDYLRVQSKSQVKNCVIFVRRTVWTATSSPAGDQL